MRRYAGIERRPRAASAIALRFRPNEIASASPPRIGVSRNNRARRRSPRTDRGAQSSYALSHAAALPAEAQSHRSAYRATHFNARDGFDKTSLCVSRPISRKWKPQPHPSNPMRLHSVDRLSTPAHRCKRRLDTNGVASEPPVSYTYLDGTRPVRQSRRGTRRRTPGQSGPRRP